MPFDLQGHRGARGLKPENTLSGFEAALDAGVTTIETDLHLSADEVPMLFHDPVVTERLCRLPPGSRLPCPTDRPPVRSLRAAELRHYRADQNPDPEHFPGQDASPTPVARGFARGHGWDVYSPPALADLFAFVEAYAGDGGRAAGKSAWQRERARRVAFDLELKRVPFRPETIGDDFDGTAPGVLEHRVVEAVRIASVVGRTTVRSFDHRAVRAVRELEPGLTTAVLVGATAPVDPVELARRAGAAVYGVDAEFLDADLVRGLHRAGVRVVPWTVNDPRDWDRLVGWGVDGITTDYPDRLARWLSERGIGP